MAIPGTASQSSTQDPLRIAIHSPQSYSAMRNAQTASLPSPRTATGIPGDTSKYGGRYNQNLIREQERKPSLPAKLSQDSQERSSRSPTPTKQSITPAPVRHNSGYKLQPIAYSPNPQEDDNRSWDEGDEDDIAPPKPTKPETKSTMPLLPPKLPLLYFEQDSVDQIDFAYQHPSKPSSASVSQTDLNCTYNREHNSFHGRERKPSPKPTPPPIDTRVGNGRRSRQREEKGRSPDRDDDGEDDDGTGARGSSFYWHSPGSTDSGDESPRPFDDDSSDKKSNEEEKKKEEEEEEESNRVMKPLIIKPIIATVPESSLTSATALGFGGPSDWQHFTDYDAEEVDDLALYTSNKPKTAELPAGNTPIEEKADRLEASISPRRLMAAADREALPTITERASENFDEESKATSSEQRSSDTSSSKDSQFSERQPTPEQSVVTSQPIIAPPVISQPIEIEKPPSPPDAIIEQVERSQPSPPKPPVAEEVKTAPSPPTVQATSPTPPTRSRVMSNQSVQSSQLNSPIDDDDDGKERIIISLQVPDTPNPNKEEPSSQPPEPQPRERQLSVATNLEPKLVESPELLRTGRMSVFPQSIEMPDPYAGLDPWAKASLNRYVKMLKEEATAGDEGEKFTIFINFAHKETKIRTVLYDIDDDSDMSDFPVQIEHVKGADGQLRPRISVRSKQLPAIPPSNEPVPSLPVQHQPVRAETMPVHNSGQKQETPPPYESGHKEYPKEKQPQPPATAPPQQTSFSAAGTPDDFVMIDAPQENKAQQHDQQQPQQPVQQQMPQPMQQQPPISAKQKQIKEKGSGQLKEKGSGHLKEKSSNEKNKGKESSGKSGTSLSSIKRAFDIVTKSTSSNKDRSATPSNLQTLLNKAGDDSKKPASPVTSVRPSTTVPDTEQPDITAEKQEQKPFKYPEGEARAYEGDKAANRQTIYRPFSGLLRQSSVQQGSADGGSKRSSVFDRRSTAAESSLSGKSPNPIDKTFEDPGKPPPRPLNYRFTILEPLLLVIPQEGVLHQEPQQLIRLRQNMDAIPDDFTFIHKTVLAWDAEAKKTRERYELERHQRAAQSEAHIDELFNGHEIGYGDISQLEADFKRQEATKKAEEDREEVGTFVSGVFDVVWARINYEMDQLTPLYEECTALVSNASAGRGMFEDTEERVPIAPSMEILLILYQKLMVRHQKAFEAVLERDRRLKKTEVAPWYALGSIEKVKRIEKRFEDAEKKAILEFCRQRDERANLLMDVLDQNTLRGVGANQDYMESIMQAVRRISTEVTIGHNGGGGAANEDAVSTDEVLKAKTITTALARSSEQIVQTFHVADMLLNAADYEVSVANAKLSNADAAAFKRLREAKAKEDNKLAMDLEHRMSLIRGDTARTQDEIGKLMGLVGKKDGASEGGGAGERSGSLGEQGQGGTSTQGAVDREKEGRMQRALEEAKRRNARK